MIKTYAKAISSRKYEHEDNRYNGFINKVNNYPEASIVDVKVMPGSVSTSVGGSASIEATVIVIYTSDKQIY